MPKALILLVLLSWAYTPFMFQLSSGPVGIPTPEAELSSGPPFRGGLAIANDITLPVAQRLGVRHVFFYGVNPALVSEAYALGLVPTVSLPDCNVQPAQWMRLAQIVREHPGIVVSFLNEPDFPGQAANTCQDWSKVILLWDGTRDMTQFYGGATWLYGNEAVARQTWVNEFRRRADTSGALMATHIYPDWRIGERVDDYHGWAARLDRAVQAGATFVTEVGTQGSADPARLFGYLAAILDAEPRIQRWYWYSGGNATLTDAGGNLTLLGWEFAQYVSD